MRGVGIWLKITALKVEWKGHFWKIVDDLWRMIESDDVSFDSFIKTVKMRWIELLNNWLYRWHILDILTTRGAYNCPVMHSYRHCPSGVAVGNSFQYFLLIQGDGGVEDERNSMVASVGISNFLCYIVYYKVHIALFKIF